MLVHDGVGENKRFWPAFGIINVGHTQQHDSKVYLLLAKKKKKRVKRHVYDSGIYGVQHLRFHGNGMEQQGTTKDNSGQQVWRFN